MDHFSDICFFIYFDRFNQNVLSYDATKEEKIDALKERKAQVEDRLRVKS